MSNNNSGKVEEQLELQRKNPHLFTTMTQSVNFDGSITTLAQVTSKITEALEKLYGFHLSKYGDKLCGGVCYYSNDDLCKIIAHYHQDVERASLSFVENYKHTLDRIRTLKKLPLTPEEEKVIEGSIFDYKEKK